MIGMFGYNESKASFIINEDIFSASTQGVAESFDLLL